MAKFAKNAVFWPFFGAKFGQNPKKILDVQYFVQKAGKIPAQCKSSGGLKCGFPVPNFGYVGPRHQPLNKKAQWPAIVNAAARSIKVVRTGTYTAFINFLLCALKFQHICVNN